MIIDDKQDDILKDLHHKEEEDLVLFLAQNKYKIPYIDLSGIAIEADALRIIDETDARNWKVAPFKATGKEFSIAFRNPETPEAQKFVSDLKNKGLIISPFLASEHSLEKAWGVYSDISFAKANEIGSVDISGETISKLGEEIKNIENIKQQIQKVFDEKSQHKATQILEVVFAGAISVGASDIHIEALEGDAEIRLRIDGVLQSIERFDLATYKTLNSRIKILSGLKLSTSKGAQDGRFSIFINNTEISIRCSMIPGEYGESIVLRILDPKSIQVKLEDMGMNKILFDIVAREISRPNGLILLTGPTGSGKTTTLYAFMQKLFSKEIKIITIEDPIEYHLPGITQTSVNHEKGYSFNDGLRSALRQDPDIIMIGEIRDKETAETAIESALTGHLVFSTLHTNNAAGVIPRLIDLGVNEKTLVSALSLSMAQRLVRKICENCKHQVQINDSDLKLIQEIISTAKANGKNIYDGDISEVKFYEGKGCEKCNNTGYKGRTGVYEAILTDESIEKIIPGKPGEREIKKTASHQGILTMREDVVSKIIQGITTIAEAKANIDMPEE